MRYGIKEQSKTEVLNCLEGLLIWIVLRLDASKK